MAEWGKGNWKLNFLCPLSEEFLDYSYFETKLFQFRNRSEERGIDWSWGVEKARVRTGNATGGSVQGKLRSAPSPISPGLWSWPGQWWLALVSDQWSFTFFDFQKFDKNNLQEAMGKHSRTPGTYLQTHSLAVDFEKFVNPKFLIQEWIGVTHWSFQSTDTSASPTPGLPWRVLPSLPPSGRLPISCGWEGRCLNLG